MPLKINWNGFVAQFWQAVDFLQTYNGAVTAFATVWIAVFTIVLAVVTGRQARLTRQAIDLNREEFISTHRPKLVVWQGVGREEDQHPLLSGQHRQYRSHP